MLGYPRESQRPHPNAEVPIGISMSPSQHRSPYPNVGVPARIPMTPPQCRGPHWDLSVRTPMSGSPLGSQCPPPQCWGPHWDLSVPTPILKSPSQHCSLHPNIAAPTPMLGSPLGSQHPHSNMASLPHRWDPIRISAPPSQYQAPHPTTGLPTAPQTPVRTPPSMWGWVGAPLLTPCPPGNPIRGG